MILLVWVTAIATAIATIAAVTVGAPIFAAPATALFSIVALADAALLFESGPRKLAAETPIHAQRVAIAKSYAVRLSTTFAWGGGTILGAYYLTDLFWHHAWQYGGAMVLIALILACYAHLVSQTHSLFQSSAWLIGMAFLALAQGIGTIAAIIFLLSTGKIMRFGADWVANTVFLAGGFVIAVISILAFVAQRQFDVGSRSQPNQ
ncbi:MAG: hypothetical protein ACR2PG_19900 [Hyphomicrobiaceae bacterium]